MCLRCTFFFLINTQLVYRFYDWHFMILLITSIMILFLRDFMQRNLVKAIYMSQVGKGKKWFTSSIYEHYRSHMRWTMKDKTIRLLYSFFCVLFFYHSLTKQTAEFCTFNKIELVNNYTQWFDSSIFFHYFFLNKRCISMWMNSFDAHSIFPPPV